MTPVPGAATLSQVKVCELSRSKQRACLYSNPLGKACYELDKDAAAQCLEELQKFQLLEAGLVYASEVRPDAERRPLLAKEWRIFQMEIGCQPLHLVCLACGRDLERLDAQKAKAVQATAGDLVKKLLDYGAELNMLDVGPQENGALHLAARFGAAQLLSQLLRLGADATALNGDGCTPELVARRSGQVLCQQILQVVLADLMDAEVLFPSARERRKQRWKESQKSRKRSDVPTQEEEGPIEENEEPRARRIAGAKYGPDDLWGMLDSDGSDGSSESEISLGAGSDLDAEERIRSSVQKLRLRRSAKAEQLQSLPQQVAEAVEERMG
ncbi:unnamed protein product [Effrenium voratum]|nr:unnamed protein product [Effrenium voratum]